LSEGGKRSQEKDENERAVSNIHVHQADGTLDAPKLTIATLSILGQETPRER
jgi:hypothetical protein